MEFAWTPDSATIQRAQLTRFLAFCGMGSFEEMHRRSVEDVPWFTDTVLRFLDIRFHRPYKQVVDLSRGIEWPEWCVGGGLNITSTCVDRHADERPDSLAVIFEGEDGMRAELTYAELATSVRWCAAGLRALGLGVGDAIGIHLPMMVETAVALLAVNRIGAVAVPLFSGFGPAAIESRLNDVGAKALFTCDAYPRRGKTVPAKDIADQALERCPGVKNVIVVNRLGKKAAMRLRHVWFHALTREGDSSAEPTAAEDPALIIYTSGTTGRPKGILHTHCGFPVKAAQDMSLCIDAGLGDRICWLTDLGWMMGPWLIYGATIIGATIVFYDGAPDYPAPDRVWEFCARNKVNILGLSPTLIRALIPHGEELPGRHDLSDLRILASTGEPWNPEPWWWLFEHVGRKRIPIINYSGGTECSGGILSNNPLLPAQPCGFAAPCPGIAADVADENGQSVRGSVGELVIRAPWIGMARGFLNDPLRYLETYWSRWPGVWTHGDWARIDADGHWYILGRSDDTLKIAGKRVGPAEVESILVGDEAVVEAGVIGVPDEQKGGAIVAFCVLRPDVSGSSELEDRLKQRVASELGKPLRPSRVLFVEGLPKTRNAKIMRRVIRAAYLGQDPGDITALENPATVQAIAQGSR